MSADQTLDGLCARGDERRSVGDYPASVTAYLEALAVDSVHAGSRRGLALCLARDPLASGRLVSNRLLGELLNDPDLDPALVSRAVLLKATLSQDPLAHPLVIDVLGQSVVTLPSMERVLTEARRELCLGADTGPPELAVALAAQGRLNEFAWSVTAEESAHLGSAPAWVRAMYGDTQPEGDGAVGAVDGTEAVRRQYEANPYPRWSRATRRPAMALGRYLGGVAGHGWDARSVPDRPDVLVAGCGTGRELIGTGLTWTTSSITAFDLSSASLAIAADQANQHGLDVDFLQADLMEFDTDRRFDLIVCTGVLHHLADPMAGWRRLRRLLRPGGVMWVGLYSEAARRGITAAQQEVHGRFDATPAGIRAARQHILSLSRGHAARDCLLLEDFYYLSGCRDLLFHEREQCFTIPQIQQAHDDLDLRFLGVEIDSAVRYAHRGTLGAEPSLAEWLTVEEAFPGTFLGMYQFWCQAPG